MATTLDDIQVGIAIDFDSSADAPATSNSEYTRRLKLINRSEKKWARAFNYRWPELFTSTTLTTTAGQAYVSLPSDFEFGNLVIAPDGEIKIGDLWYKLITKDYKDVHYDSAYLCWITGNPSAGYRLNIQPTPTDQVSIPLNYYSNYLATNTSGTDQALLSTGTDKTKISDADFLVYDVLAQLYKDDDEGNKGLDFERLANDRLEQMKSLASRGQQNQLVEIPDLAELQGYPSIGN